jgi:Lecithin retinol acyltransferase
MTIPHHIDVHQGARNSKADHRKNHWHRRALIANWVSVEDLEPPLGAHLATPRLGYLHHGIYVGGGNVVHYAGYVNGLIRRPVEEVKLARFRAGRSLWLATKSKSDFDRSEVIQRARSRIDENRYRLLTNNCEHFCEWCLNGEQRSYQVEALVAWARRAVAAPVKVIVHLLLRLSRNGTGRVLASFSDMASS